MRWKVLTCVALAALIWSPVYWGLAQGEATRTRISVNVPRVQFHNAKPAITVATPYLKLGDHWTVVNADISVDYVDFDELVLNLQRELESRLSDTSPAQYVRIDVIVWDSNPTRYVGRVPLEVFRP
jgi:hypothetical protein